jgi:hypothetical protein
MAKTDKQPKPDGNQPQPGTVISPGAAAAQPPAAEPPAAAEPVTVAEIPSVEPQPQPSAPAAYADIPTAGQPEPQDVPFEMPESQFDGVDDQAVTWTASEFIAHDKSAGWYAGLALVTLALGAAVFFLNRDFISVSVVVIGGLLIGVYAGHQPRALEYVLNGQGLSIGQKYYSYDQFKSFSIMEEGAFSSIMFMPLKRFAVTITAHYPPEDEDKILSILSGRLPMEKHRYDAVDTLMRRIRF